MKPEDWISQAEAARIRNVSQQAIANLITRGRLTTLDLAGRTLVLRSEVEAFVALPKLGRPPKTDATKKADNKSTPKKKPSKKEVGSKRTAPKKAKD